jgi:hypothetical protein
MPSLQNTYFYRNLESVHHSWLVLMVIVLASCGQPLQRQPTRQPTQVGVAGSLRPTRIVPGQTPKDTLSMAMSSPTDL